MKFALLLVSCVSVALADRRREAEDLVVKPNSYKQNCKEGDRWMDDRCNRCRCVEDKAVCTRKLCPGGERLVPTDGWQNVFNIDPDHRRTRRETHLSDAVVKPDSYKSDCHPKDTWTDQDCNSCHCGEDKRAVCTRRTCSDGQRLQPTPDWQHALNLRL